MRGGWKEAGSKVVEVTLPNAQAVEDMRRLCFLCYRGDYVKVKRMSEEELRRHDWVEEDWDGEQSKWEEEQWQQLQFQAFFSLFEEKEKTEDEEPDRAAILRLALLADAFEFHDCVRACFKALAYKLTVDEALALVDFFPEDLRVNQLEDEEGTYLRGRILRVLDHFLARNDDWYLGERIECYEGLGPRRKNAKNGFENRDSGTQTSSESRDCRNSWMACKGIGAARGETQEGWRRARQGAGPGFPALYFLSSATGRVQDQIL